MHAVVVLVAALGGLFAGAVIDRTTRLVMRRLQRPSEAP
jgi:hypothetical protein